MSIWKLTRKEGPCANGKPSLLLNFAAGDQGLAWAWFNVSQCSSMNAPSSSRSATPLRCGAADAPYASHLAMCTNSGARQRSVSSWKQGACGLMHGAEEQNGSGKRVNLVNLLIGQWDNPAQFPPWMQNPVRPPDSINTCRSPPRGTWKRLDLLAIKGLKEKMKPSFRIVKRVRFK